MKLAIIWICAVASLCGSIEANVLRHDGSRKAQVVDSVTNNVADDDTENDINDYDASKEELEPNTESSFAGDLKERFELTPKPSVNLQRSTTRRSVNLQSSTTSRSVIPEHLLAEIQKKYPTTRPPYPLSIKKSVTTPEPTPETTTEYKYKYLVEAYTVPQAKYVPMHHVAGTHYVKVDRGQDEHERVIEDYNRLFNHGSYPTQPDDSAPPKI